MSDPTTPKTNEDTKKAAPRAPAPSQIDQERSDWEGMGQSRFQPEAPPPSKPVGEPTPGANPLAGDKQE